MRHAGFAESLPEPTAMTTNLWRWLLAILVSITLLAALLIASNFTFPDPSNFKPKWLGVMLAAHILMVCFRGLLFLTLSTAELTSEPSHWIRLAARHQTVFSVLPSGTGDLTFPMMAKRFVPLGPSEALRMIILFRQRDLIVLAAIALAGLSLLEGHIILAGITFFGGGIALWFSDDVFRLGAKGLESFIPEGRLSDWISGFAVNHKAPLCRRAAAWLFSLLIWIASIVAVLSSFAAAGQSISIGAALLFLAFVNLAGVIAISVAGLGVSETGAATALMLIGRSIEHATATALVVRPALLFSVLVSSLLLDLAIGMFGRWQRR